MLVLDLESSGTNPQKHSIVSIGAIDFNDPQRTFYKECKIWEGAHIYDQSLEVNGFNEAEIKDQSKESEGEIVGEFLNWAMESPDHTIAGHNPFFDLFFLQAGAERAKINFPLAHRVIDLHSICYFHMKERGIEPPLEKKRSALNSDLVMEYVGIPTEPRPHNALNGAKWEAEAFSRLFYEKSLFPEFGDYKIPWAN